MNNDRIANWTLSFKRSLFKMGLLDIPGCDRCQGTSKMASHFLLTGTQSVLRFRYLGHHFVKPGDFADVSFSSVLYFVQSAGLLESLSKGLHRRQAMIKFQGSPWCLSNCTVLYSASKDHSGAYPTVLYCTLLPRITQVPIQLYCTVLCFQGSLWCLSNCTVLYCTLLPRITLVSFQLYCTVLYSLLYFYVPCS